MAFWEYVLLLEICYKILEKDQERHVHNHTLYEPYRKLAELYRVEGYSAEGDFSERIGGLMEKISSEYTCKYENKEDVRLSAPQVTELLYCHDIKELLKQIIEYMKYKGTLWLLFDNIDKGWPTSGLGHEDLIIIRALIDASRKIERTFNRHKIEVNSIVFLRNDVYELLVAETSDRGKEANVVLDWTDPDLLREMLRLRIISNSSEKPAFERVWLQVCTSHYKGEESSQYFIDRSLMRPRFLLNLVNQCKSFAINLNHKKILENDIEKGLSAYSSDLLTDIGYELMDIAPEATDILYAFIDSPSTLTDEKLQATITDYGVKADLQKIIDMLLWYGFLGVRVDNMEDTKYIYNFNYNMRLLKGLVKKKARGSLLFTINPAFWPALLIEN